MKKISCILLLLFSVSVSQFCFFIEQASAEKCTFTIGAILPLTGNAAIIGNFAKQGIELALKEITSSGVECSIKVIYEDSAFESAKGVTAFQSLIARENISLVITGATHVSLAIAPIAHQKEIPQFAIFTSSKKYSSSGDLSYRIANLTTDEIIPIFNFIEREKIAPLGMLYIENEFGVGLSTELRNMLTKENKTVAFEESFIPAQSDFKALLTKLKSLKTNGLLVIGLPIHIKQIIKQAREIEYFPHIFTGRSAQDVSLLNDPNLPQNFFFSDLLNPQSSNQNTKNFIENFKLNFQTLPVSYAGEAYEALRIAESVLSKCKNSKECFKEFMSTENFDTIFGKTTFDSYGDPRFKCHLRGVKDGASYFIE